MGFPRLDETAASGCRIFFFQTLACASSLLSDAEEPTSIGSSISMKPRSESAVREAEVKLGDSGGLASPSLLFLFY